IFTDPLVSNIIIHDFRKIASGYNVFDGKRRGGECGKQDGFSPRGPGIALTHRRKRPRMRSGGL
ncbi:MAG: hypothetical protein ACLVAI_05690, partial [Anaerovoracaceae bacterium]